MILLFFLEKNPLDRVVPLCQPPVLQPTDGIFLLWSGQCGAEAAAQGVLWDVCRRTEPLKENTAVPCLTFSDLNPKPQQQRQI